MTMTARAIRARLRSHAVPANVAIYQRFFKTGPGEYGEGDTFIGVKVPNLRSVCGECRGVSFDVVLDLLHSKIHEERLLALLILVDAFQRGDDATRKRVYDLYLANTACTRAATLLSSASPNHVPCGSAESPSSRPTTSSSAASSTIRSGSRTYS